MPGTHHTDTTRKTSAEGRVVIMTAGGTNPQIMINALARHFPDIHVVQEQPESKTTILKRRARALGWSQAVGQLATMVVSRLFKSLAAKRSADIIHLYDADATVSHIPTTVHVASLNDAECHRLVNAIGPDVIVTISCRILKPSTLAAFTCPIINFHAGINPQYRGQMGGYWSLVEKDAANFGATVHLVDKGVDTGGTLYEQRMTADRSDTISTYPLLLTAGSTGIVIRAIDDALSGRLAPRQPKGQSTLRYPPTIWTWIRNGLTKRIW